MVHAKSQVDKSALMAAQSQSFIEGQRVWVPLASSSASEWASGVIVGVSRGADEKVTLSVSVNDETISVPAMQCFLQNESDPDDLTKSDYLHEPGILNTLRTRYQFDSIYTYSGQILIALNPFKPLKHLFGPRMIAEYRRLESLEDLAPHCYAVAESAFQNMMIDGKRQAVLISGESGAGKTVTARLVMAYLAERSVQGALTALPIEQQILESNPLLEAFGNAKTVRNDNSSRFGKFVEINFSESGRVTGANISTYLLERSRVISISENERSFHIFYQLLAGCSPALRGRLFLPAEADASTFGFLAQSTTVTLEGTDDAETFEETLKAMKIVGLDDEQIEAVLGLVAAVLHLGNIEFEAAANASADEAVVKSNETSIKSLENAACLLGTSAEELQRALMSRKISIGDDVIVKEFNVLESIESRDSLAKSLYARLFDWLVSVINEKIGRQSQCSRSISVLDIYGFESFQTNSFEQLCINLANEKLQQSFNEHVFKEEQKLYVEEGIDWSFVDYLDNIDVLELLEGTSRSETTPSVLPPNIGIFPLLDEACRLPRATNEDLAVTIRAKLKNHPRFSAPKRDPTTFCINHYAGEVRYDTSAHMIERNRGFEILEQEKMMMASTRWLPRALYNKGGATAASTDPHRSAFKLSTIGATFLKQLNTLSSRLAEMDPHYVRCIKPNEYSRPGSLQPSYVMDQLRAGGVLEAVRIACAGFPTRKAFSPFARRYIMLADKDEITKGRFPQTDIGAIDWSGLSTEQEAAIVAAIMRQTNLEGWQLGRSRLFLRTGHLAFLEARRGRVLTELVIIIQAHWRAFSSRSRYQKILREQRAAIMIQKFWRMWHVRHCYEAILERNRKAAAALRIQTNWRMVIARRSFVAQCLALEEIARQDVAAALEAEGEASGLAAFEAEEARQAAVSLDLSAENEALKEEIASLKSVIADLECKLAESISTSMLVTEATQVSEAAQDAIQNLHDKIEQLNLRHAEETTVLSESLTSSKSKVHDLERELSDKEAEVSRLVEQLQASTARIDQLANELLQSREKGIEHDEKLREEQLNASNALGRISALESLLSAEKASAAESLATIRELNNDHAVMSSRIDSLMQQLQRAENEIAQLRLDSIQPQVSATRRASLDIGCPLVSSEIQAPSIDENKARIVDLVVCHLVKPQSTVVYLREDAPIPLTSWRLRNFLSHIMFEAKWNWQEVEYSVDKIVSHIGIEAAKNFSACIWAVNMVISSWAMIQVDSVGQSQTQRNMSLQVSSKMMEMKGLWKCLGDFVVDKVPLNTNSLFLKEDARRSAPFRGPNALKYDSLTFEKRFERCMGSSSKDWLKLIGSIDHLTLMLLENMPPSMAKPIVWATLKYIDGIFLNALLMRRDLCSVSSARSILTALAIVEAYMTTYRLSISTEDYREAFQRTLQACSFLVEWFDDAVRQARSGMVERNSALNKCSALEPLQIKRLAEWHHDELLGFGHRIDTSILLQAINSMLASEQSLLPRSVSRTSEGEEGMVRTPGKDRALTADETAMPSPMSPAEEDATDQILVDCRFEFALGGPGQSKRAKKLILEASKALFSPGDSLSFIDARCAAARDNALPEELAFVNHAPKRSS